MRYYYITSITHKKNVMKKIQLTIILLVMSTLLWAQTASVCTSVPNYAPFPTIYSSGDRVQHNGILYECQTNNLYNVTPGTAEHWWKTIEPCGGSNQQPQVTIASPSIGQVFTGLSPISFSVNATDDGTVNHVTYTINGQNEVVTGSNPFTYNWVPTAFGSYTLNVIATDNQNIVSDVVQVTFVVQEQTTEVVKYAWPLKLAPGFEGLNKNGYAINYPDHGVGGNTLDYNGGKITYSGHSGTDVGPYPLGWTSYHEGKWDVIAAAPGVIMVKVDTFTYVNTGNGCRKVEYPGASGGGNRIVIQHVDGRRTTYAHLKLGTLTTKQEGDVVAEGEFLGKIGSTGNSSGPHLHFDIKEGNTVLDPWFGPSNPSVTESLWKNQLAYSTARITEIVLGYHSPYGNHCEREDRIYEKQNVYLGEEFLISRFYQQSRGDITSHIKLKRPNGTVYHQFDWAHLRPEDTQANASTVWPQTIWIAGFTINPNEPGGTWVYEEEFDGTVYTKEINVINQVNSAPSVSFISPQAGQQVASNTAVNVELNATDSDGIKQVIYGYREYPNAAATEANQYKEFVVTGAAPYHFEFTPLYNKPYTINAVVIDNKETRTNVNVSFTVGGNVNQPPVVTMLTPSAGQTFTSLATIVLSANATDDGAVDHVTFTIGGQDYVVNGNNPFNQNWTPTAYGNYQVTAVATDNEGINSGPVTVSFSVNEQTGCTDPGWVTQTVYVKDNIISHNGKRWKAKWWTQNEEPGTASQWGVWEDLGVCNSSRLIASTHVQSFTTEGISLYPNPSSENITIAQNGQVLSNVHIRIIDIEGKTVIETDQGTINVSSLPQGLYQVLVNTENFSATDKFMIRAK